MQFYDMTNQREQVQSRKSAKLRSVAVLYSFQQLRFTRTSSFNMLILRSKMWT